jgi:moderate conductance mechanosensitive channel
MHRNLLVLWLGASVAIFVALVGGVVAQQPTPPAKDSLAAAIDAPARSLDASGGSAAPVRELVRIVTSGSWPELMGWLAEHGVAVIAIVAVVSAILWLANMLEGRIVALLARRGEHRPGEESEARARTLVSVLHNALRTVAVVVGFIMVLDELAVPIGPLLGGVAVIGLAVAFGAQSLIKDYFTGFMVLLEQQYVIGDVVQLGASVGEVERITLRLTVLRDQEGRVHFIPHGQITTVINLTHGWARAVVEIRVAYREDVDRVIDELHKLADGLRADEDFGPLIIDAPQILGVDALSNTSLVVKLRLKTLPTKRDEVKRELLRRIKRRFSELGIEMAA